MRDDSPILVATDLQPGGDDAIREGHLRALAQRAPLVVCHVITPRAADEVAYEAVAQRVFELTGRGPEAVDILLAEGTPAETIVAEAAGRDAGLIVIGPGRTRFVTGSTTAKVIRHAHCAVLVARPAVASTTVLAGTDFSDPSYRALESGSSEARRIDGELLAMHVVPIEPIMEADVMGMAAVSMAPAMTEELRHLAEERLAGVLAERHLEGRVCAMGGQAGAEIVRVAAGLPAHLIVVGTHGRTGWRRLLVGSVAEEVARAAPCSVLIERTTADA